MSGNGEQFVINIQNAPKHPKYEPLVDGKSTISTMLVPIASSAHEDGQLPKTICILQFRNKNPRHIKDTKGLAGNRSSFRADDCSFLQNVALKSSILFEQAVELQEAKLYADYHKQCQYEVQALTTMSEMLASGAAMEELFPLVCKEACQLMSCDRASLFLVRKTNDKEELWSQVSIGVPPIALPLKETSIAGSSVLSNEIVNIPNAYADSRFDPTFDKKYSYRTRSILCVPVMDRGADLDDPDDDVCLGCLQLINKKDKFDRIGESVFLGKDQTIAENFCAVVAIAIKNAAADAMRSGAAGLAANVAKDGRSGHTVRLNKDELMKS